MNSLLPPSAISMNCYYPNNQAAFRVGFLGFCFAEDLRRGFRQYAGYWRTSVGFDVHKHVPKVSLSSFKGAVSREFLPFFNKQGEARIPLFIYKTILKHQEKEIHQVLKKEQVMVCSSPF